MTSQFMVWLTAGFLALSAVSGAEVYRGVFENKKIKRAQKIQLDLIDDYSCRNDPSKKCTYIAILKLFFGDWNSDEYMSYHFEGVVFNEIDKTLVLVHPDQEVSLFLSQPSQGRWVGTFRSSFGGDCGEVELKVSQAGYIPQSSFSFLEPLMGEYEGQCESGQLTRLQLFSFRSVEDTSKIGNPFASYKLYANWAIKDRSLCPDKSPFCVVGIFDKGTYNFFEDELILMGPKRNVACRTFPGGLFCGKCQLNRIESIEPLHQTDKKNIEDVFPDRDPAINISPESLQGVYQGFLYHEFLGVYQRAEVNIKTFQDPSQNHQMMISANAHLFFGEYEEKESISYRFETTPFPKRRDRTQFIFSRPDADLDAILQVEELGEGFIRGTWYSTLFGRVGPFELNRNKKVSLPKGSQIMKSISGFYSGKTWDLNLAVELGQTPLNSDNPFHPLTFSGWSRLKELAFRVTILDGSYDFYTGKLGLILNHPSVFTGLRLNGGRLMLKKPAHLYGVNLNEFELDHYEFVSSEHPF